jgi:small subunit ribosomal protein S11
LPGADAAVAVRSKTGVDEVWLKGTFGKTGGAKKGSATCPPGRFTSASFNNTIVTVTDTGGNTVAWGPADQGFRARARARLRCPSGCRAGHKAAQQLGIQGHDLFVKGPGPGRENAIRAVQALGLKVRSMSDITPIPHNGCRPPKKRRV